MKYNSVEAITPEWLSLKQLTRYANVSERTLRTWIHSPIDPLPAVRLAGKILVKRSELDAWLERRRIKKLAAVNLDGIVRDILQGAGRGR
jgi:excisionase family DNA binding protein